MFRNIEGGAWAGGGQSERNRTCCGRCAVCGNTLKARGARRDHSASQIVAYGGGDRRVAISVAPGN
ncbi:MAG TPA: hypothetical protein VHY10_08000, partial [Xanthobacteraceae bacterium]|nr:hypothetical protein [Xanthobacteraceae bacterium]